MRSLFVKLLIILFILASSLFSQSQTDVGIVVHIIRNSQQNGGASVADVNSAIGNLNSAFSPTGIHFFISELNYIDNDYYYSQMGSSDRATLFDQYNKYADDDDNEHAINLYFTASGGIPRGESTFPPTEQIALGLPHHTPGIIFNNNIILTSTIPHEFGHFFGLFHTYETHFGFEFVDGTNCSVAGDLLCDTPAEPDPNGQIFTWIDCEMSGSKYDSHQDEYVPDPSNFMSSAHESPTNPDCRNHFSVMQRNKIINTFNNGERSDLKQVVWVKFTNKIEETNLGGSFSVDGISFSSGNYYPFPADPVNVKTNQERFDNIYKHFYWNENIAEYRLALSYFQAASETPDQYTNYNQMNNCTLTVFEGISTLNVEFRDPWYLMSDLSQPNIFQSFSTPYSPTGAQNQSSGGVFLNRPPNETNPEIPYYSVRVPFLKQNSEFNYSIFNEWQYDSNYITLIDDPHAMPDQNQKAIIFTQSNAILNAYYHKNISSPNSTIYVTENGEIKIKTANYVATTEGIYQFSHWTSSMPDSINFISSTTFDTKIEIIGSNFNITPNYENVFDLTFPPDEIVIDQNLQIPAGAYYEVPHNMRIRVDSGKLEINGTLEQPVIIDSGPMPLSKMASEAEKWQGFKLTGGILDINFTTIKNAEIAITATGGKFYINNSVFANSEVGIKSQLPLYNQGPMKVHNCTFSDLDTAVIWNDLETSYTYTNYADVRNCIFYNNTGPDIFVFRHQRYYTLDTLAYNLFYPAKSPNIIKIDSGTNPVEYGNLFGTNPQFKDVSNGDYHLTWGSICIDHGDPAISNDPDNTRCDIGAYYYPQINGGNISVNTIWDGDLRILNDLTLNTGIELNILPGTNIFMSPDVSINVNGKFTAVGTTENPIKFTSVYENPSTSQYWDRIRFNDSADDDCRIEHCIIEYADYGPYFYYSNGTLNSNEIHNIYYYGIYGCYSDLTINNNNISNVNTYGICIVRGNYASGQSAIYYNQIENTNRGVYLYMSSPEIKENEISGCTYGIYAYLYSNSKLGWMGTKGKNYIHNNSRGLYSYYSNPFLGQSMCSINGGYNRIESSSTYQIDARSNSYVLAEQNYWANDYNFYQDGTSTVDHIPYLSSPPFSKPRVSSPEVALFDQTFDDKLLGDSTITDEEVMERYDEDWIIFQKLNYARNLFFLGFPHLTEKICRSVIDTYPDSSGVYLAMGLLWDAGRLTDTESRHFKLYLDSLANLGDEKEIYEQSEFILDGFTDESALTKRPITYYQKYKSTEVASNALLRDFLFYLDNMEDYTTASRLFTILKTEYPNSQATFEAIDHLGMMKNNSDLPESLIIPEDYKLIGNYPNPFNPGTSIKFLTPNVSTVEITIFNILGQKVKTLYQESVLPGVNEIYWDGKNENGVAVPSGTYIYRFTAESIHGRGQQFSSSAKMVLIK